MNVNKVIIAGNLTRDPELKYLPKGTAILKFSIAINREYKQGEEKKKEVSFPTVIAWGKTAEIIAEHFTKGQAIFVEGRIQTRSWDDKDGKKQYATEVICENFQFVGPKKDKPEEQAAGQDDAGFSAAQDSEHIPF